MLQFRDTKYEVHVVCTWSWRQDLFSHAPPTVLVFLPLVKLSLPLAKIYHVASAFVFLKCVNVFKWANKQNIMAELSQIKEFLKIELTPIHAKLVIYGGKAWTTNKFVRIFIS